MLNALHSDSGSLAHISMSLIVVLHLSGEIKELALKAQPVNIFVSVRIHMVKALGKLGVELFHERGEIHGDVGDSGNLRGQDSNKAGRNHAMITMS